MYFQLEHGHHVLPWNLKMDWKVEFREWCVVQIFSFPGLCLFFSCWRESKCKYFLPQKTFSFNSRKMSRYFCIALSRINYCQKNGNEYITDFLSNLICLSCYHFSSWRSNDSRLSRILCRDNGLFSWTSFRCFHGLDIEVEWRVLNFSVNFLPQSIFFFSYIFGTWKIYLSCVVQFLLI